MNNVLTELGKMTGRGRDGVSFEDLFRDADRLGAFHFASIGRLGDALGLVGDIGFMIRISVTDPWGAAYTGMHEITHGAPRSGDQYNHFEMAEAAYAVAGRAGLLSKLANTSSRDDRPNPGEFNPFKTPRERTIIGNQNAGLFQHLVMIACPKPRR